MEAAGGISSCPVCGEAFHINELERHVNSHLDEEENARNCAIAWELASTSQLLVQVWFYGDVNSGNESSVTCHVCDVLVPLEDWDNHCHLHEIQAQEHLIVERDNVIENSVIETPKLSEKTALLNKLVGVSSLDMQQLIINQERCKFKRIDEGIMNLLRDCLYSENQKSSTVIATNIDHFETCATEDIGWGCGWRNIQMLSSHLLTHTWGRKALFGGAGFVPDIPSLQQWLEFGWANGFDEPGAKFYQHKIRGSKEWIGTTECATLFRSFGLRARLIDFSGKSKSDGQMTIDRWLHHPTILNINTEIDNPSSLFVDKQIHHNVQCDICGIYPIRGVRFKSKKRSDYDLCAGCMSKDGNQDDYEQISCPSKGKEVANDEDVNHESLVNWVWNHFIRGIKDVASKAQLDKFQGHVCTSGCTPLYFQHQGHSRTIVGMQRRKTNGSKEDLFLLILDPSTRTNELVHALRSRNQWQKLIKRGVHTLKKRSYQVCYIDPGIAGGEELQQLKTLKSELFHY